MKVRPCSDSDLKQVVAIYHDAIHALAAPYYSQEQLAAWAPEKIEESRMQKRLSHVQTIVMDAEGVIAGFASYEANGHLDLLFTHPLFARKRVATRLCESVETSLAQSGVRKVFTEASLAARAFFENRGYRVLREESADCRGVQLTRLAMEKQIS